MTLKEKHEYLLEFSEDKLRKEVLVPLLLKLGFHDPIIYHHAFEKGKDIICKELDKVFGRTRYIALVVKKGDVTGSSSGSNSYFTVSNQIKQAINEPYKDVYELREIQIDQVIIVVCGKILPTALESIYGTLKAEKIDKTIRSTIDLEKLITLIDDKFPEFWNEATDSRDSLIRQRNILLNNLSKLLKVLVPDSLKHENTINRLMADEYDVEIFPFQDFANYMIDVGYRRISIEEIDPEFTQPFLNTDYGNIKQDIFELKKEVQEILMNIDDSIDPLRKILKEKNPRAIIDLIEDAKFHINYHGRMSVDASKLVDYSEIENAISQYENRRGLLQKADLFDFYAKIMNDMQNKVRGALKAYWQKYGRETKDRWLGYQISFSLEKVNVIESDVYEFTEDPKIITDGHFPERELSKIYFDEKGTLHIEYAVNWYGFYQGEKLTLEQKVSEFMWHYDKSLAEEFFKLLEAPT